MQHTIGWHVTGGFWFLGVACWLGMWLFGLKARRLTKPGATPRSMRDLDAYTDEGVHYVNLCHGCILGFFVCWALCVGVAVATESFIPIKH
jgi:hypothetical protein